MTMFESIQAFMLIILPLNVLILFIISFVLKKLQELHVEIIEAETRRIKRDIGLANIDHNFRNELMDLLRGRDV